MQLGNDRISIDRLIAGGLLYNERPEWAARYTNELRRLGKLDYNWLHIERIGKQDGKHTFRAKFTVHTPLKEFCQTGQDLLAVYGLSQWIANGPKIFVPTKEQVAALEQVKVNLSNQDYEQPFEKVMVLLQDHKIYEAVLCSIDRGYGFITWSLISHTRENDITTASDLNVDQTVEEVINTFADDCKDQAELSVPALRVAINSCLALCNFGNYSKYLYQKEAARDTKLAKEKSERGTRAKERLADAIQQLQFSQNVKLHETSTADAPNLGKPGYKVVSHWRRGHWAMQAYGKGHTLRKRIYRKPVLVHKDRFTGDVADTVYTARG